MFALPNTLDLSLAIRSTELMPYTRRALLFGIQKTLIAEYNKILLLSKQNLNKDVEALIHSGHDEKNLYVQFRIGEKDRPSINPESLIQIAAECKTKLENLYNRAIKAVGYLRRCTESSEKIEF